MDKYLAKPQSSRTPRSQSQPSVTLVPSCSATSKMTKLTPKNKKDKSPPKLAIDSGRPDHPSPELLSRDDITLPNLFPSYSPEILPEPENISATLVAQEVSRLLCRCLTRG